MHSKAKKWFEHAIKVHPEWSEAFYGLTICQLKLKENLNALSSITKAI